MDPTELLSRIRQAEITQDRFRQQAKIAENDPLTGLKNCRFFGEQCELELARAESEGAELSVAVLDLDYLKQINDTFGHAVGDKALCAIAKILKEHLRQSDLPARIGGDEFAVLLPSTTTDEALQLIDAIRVKVTQVAISAGDQEVSLRMTAGVAGKNDGVSTIKQLTDRADQALMAAKHSGRNRVLSFEGTFGSESEGDPCATGAQSLLESLVAADVMTVPIISLQQSDHVSRAANIFLELRIDAAPVLDESGLLTGVISQNELLNHALANEPSNIALQEIMCTNFLSFDVNTSIPQICDAFRRNSLQRVFIVKSGVPAGIVSRGAVLRLLGNWDAINTKQRHAEKLLPSAQAKETRVREVVQTVTKEVQKLEEDFNESSSEGAVELVSTATRLQELASELLVLSQNEDSFEA